MKKRLVIGNWKMYVQTPQEVTHFARTLRRASGRFSGVEVALAPSFPLIPALAAALKGSKIKTAAQTLSRYESGAHTGDVSAATLRACGTSLVIVGHSERRALGEEDEQIAEEVRRAAEQKLTAVLCIGERSRDASGAHFELLEEQLSSALKNFPKASSKNLVVAYEPVWAIGKTAMDAMKPEQLRETVIFIRKILADTLGREMAMRTPILYGGSVEPGNARALITEGDVSGFLVGHASAALDSFLEILIACKK